MANSYLLLETGDRLLLETGDRLLLEESTGSTEQVPAAIRVSWRALPAVLLAGATYQTALPRNVAPRVPSPPVVARTDGRQLVPRGMVVRCLPPRVLATISPPIPGFGGKSLHSISRFRPWVGGPSPSFLLQAPAARVAIGPSVPVGLRPGRATVGAPRRAALGIPRLVLTAWPAAPPPFFAGHSCRIGPQLAIPATPFVCNRTTGTHTASRTTGTHTPSRTSGTHTASRTSGTPTTG